MAATTAGGTNASVALVPAGRLAGLRFHVVTRGQGLAAIAKRYRVDAAQIRRANGIMHDGVYSGARLLLDEPDPTAAPPGWGAMSTPASPTARHPSAAPIPAAPVPGSPVTYTTVAGDTLERIARRTDTTVAALLAANGLKITATLQVGQVVALSAAATPAVPAPPARPISKQAATKATAKAHAVSCPVSGSTFNFDWGFPREGGRYHEGTDMFAPAGTPVRAAVGGTIAYATSSMSGLNVTLRGNDGWQYFGAHLAKSGTRKSTVKAGDVIGYVGNSGDAAGGPTHLHIEMRPLDGRPTNPYPFLVSLCQR